jgi:hypothetical protein
LGQLYLRQEKIDLAIQTLQPLLNSQDRGLQKTGRDPDSIGLRRQKKQLAETQPKSRIGGGGRNAP